MFILLSIIELISAIGVIILVLLHSPKGEGLGSIGNSARMFSSSQRGLEAGLNKLTFVFCAVFIITAILIPTTI